MHAIYTNLHRFVARAGEWTAKSTNINIVVYEILYFSADFVSNAESVVVSVLSLSNSRAMIMGLVRSDRLVCDVGLCSASYDAPRGTYVIRMSSTILSDPIYS